MKKVVPILILAMFLGGATLQVVRIIWRVAEKRQLDYGEGIVLYQSSLIFHLKKAFHPLEQYPHVAFQYPPVYLIATKLVTKVLGDPLLSGRLVSMMAGLWVVGLFAWTVLRATRGYAPHRVRWFGALFAAACVLLLPTMLWVPFARVDMLGLALQFTALSVIAVMPFRLRNQIVAFCLLLLGLYTKQSLLAIPIASVLLIGLIRPIRAVWLSCGLVAAGLGILAVLVWVTEGGVLRHWIRYLVNPLHPRYIFDVESAVSENITALIGIGLAAFWLTFPRTGRTTRPNWRSAVSARLMGSPLRRTGVGFGLAVAFGFVTSWGVAKEGANFDYCLDWQLALCPLTGIFLILFARNWTRQDRAMALLRPLLALLLGATGLQLGMQAVWDCNRALGLTGTARRARNEALQEEMNLVKLISTFPGPVVSDNMSALLRAGKSIPFEPFIIKATTATGVFDESTLLKKTSDRFFDAFILNADNPEQLYSPRMLQAIRQNYRLYPFGGSTYLVYVRPATP